MKEKAMGAVVPPVLTRRPEAAFARLLRDKLAVFERKNADYAGEKGTYFNFEYAAKVAEPFTDPVDKVFATMLGIKLGRLAVLKQPGKVPNHESVLDSHGDFTTYAGIWEAWEAEK
jgi:hypothetical protein